MLGIMASRGRSPPPRVRLRSWTDPEADISIRIIVADDHLVVREGVKRLLSKHVDMQVVGEATCGEEVLDVMRRTPADVVLLDIAMPGLGFLQVLRQARKLHRDIPILVLSASPEDQYALRCLRAGASGYVCKSSLVGELAEAVRRLASGGRYVSPGFAESLVDLAVNVRDGELHEGLSQREFEILCLTARGTPVKVIAHTLNLSPKTVSTYRRRVRQKLEVRSQAEVIRYAVEKGLVGEPQA